MKVRVSSLWGSQVLNKGNREDKLAHPYLAHSKISPKTFIKAFRAKKGTTVSEDFYQNEYNILTSLVEGVWELISRHYSSSDDLPRLDEGVSKMIDWIGNRFDD